MVTRTGTPAPAIEIIGEPAPEIARDEWMTRIKQNWLGEPRILSVPTSQLLAEVRAEAG